MSCDDTCGGKKINARCVDYEGLLPADTSIANCSKPSVHDVLEDSKTILDNLKAALDTSSLGDSCVSYEGTEVRDILLGLETKLCEIEEFVGLPNPDCAECNPCPSIFTQDISCMGLDYGALSDACGNPITNLTELFQALLDASQP